MKSKIIIAAIAFFTFTQMQSQVTFKPGLRAGANFSHFTQDDDYDNEYTTFDQFNGTFVQYRSNVEFSNKTDFYAGFYGALRLTKYYTLQPEINYSRQGSKIEYTTVNLSGNAPNRRVEGQYDISYLSIAVINKFTFSDKFNVHLGPTIDFVVDKSRDLPIMSNNGPTFGYDETYQIYGNGGNESDVDLAFYAGFGYNFTRNIGIEARIKKGIIPVIDTYDNDHTNVVYSIGVAYTFDMK